MRGSVWPSVGVFAVLASFLLVSYPAPAQVNGPPASVTSPGFGGNAVNGPRASVTSLGPQGYTPRPPLLSAGNGFHHRDRESDTQRRDDRDSRHRDHDGDDRRRHHRDNSDSTGPVWYAYPVPYAVDNSLVEDQPADSDADDADNQGGPTIFDRRGSGPDSYVPREKNSAPAHATDRGSPGPVEDAQTAEPDPPLSPTVLVFKTGQKLEVENYAIQGSTLFDLTPGHRRKIAIADLDLAATRTQNDERGVTFDLPQSARVN